jgi:hypothetical protein
LKPKKYSSQSIIGQKGINLIEKIVLDMGFVWNPTNLEAGIDGTIEIRNADDEATNFIIQVQSKATERPFTAETDLRFEYICDERDLDYWLKGNCPVILICSNVIENRAYWVSIKDYFKDSNIRKNRKIIFDKSKNSFSKLSKEALLELAVNVESGFYLSPPPITETIYSNLLPLSKLPEKIYIAETQYRKYIELWDDLNQLENKAGINKSYILNEGKIYSFNDLSKAPWNSFVVVNTIDNFATTEWSLNANLDIKRIFVQLMNNSFDSFIYHKKLLHKKTPKVNLYYFRPDLDEHNLPKTMEIKYKRLGRNSHQTVCDRYYRKSDPSILSYFRHLAFEAHFLRFASQWYIEITPTYYFTHDGFKIHTYYESKLKGKKGLDKAEIVFSETLFWADILTRGKDDLFVKSKIEFQDLYSDVIDVGFNDKVWLAKEDEEKKVTLENQLSLFTYED